MDLWVRSGGCAVSRRFPGILPPRLPAAATMAWKKGRVGAVCCSLQPEVDTQPQLNQHIGITCDICNDSGWMICDFCQGQKTNVKSKSSRFYRRCPYCKAVGLILCPKCRVFKCVTFPDIRNSEA